MIIYSGPSLIDGKPIVAIVTGYKKDSPNTKTGAMLQTYIIRADINPLEASKTGEDYSICGSCPHRGVPTNDPQRKIAERRSCYVNLGQGVLHVYKSLQRGIYRTIAGHDGIAALGAGRMVRLGTYGDPAAVPSYIWESLISRAAGHTAYTHQSGVASAQARPAYMMISADNLEQAKGAWAIGYRTFRVIKDTRDVVRGSEILCPASKEAGARVQCAACGLCAGAQVKAKSIAIVDHGPQRKRAA